MKELFIKYIKRECSEEEIHQIVSYFQNSKDFSDVPTIEAIYQLLEEYPNMDEASANRISKNILEMAHQKQAAPIKKKPQFWKYAAAAILVIALGSSYLLRNTIFKGQRQSNMPIIVNNQIEPGSDKATLTLDDGTEVILVKGASVQTQNATSNGEEIIYSTINSTSSELVYNYLSVPRGGQFFLKLSDGTQIWLNSESRLKYPVSFTEGESRQVELVYGEAFFEVSPSSEHKGANFKVIHNQQEVQVLGTEFNIKAYKDESNVYTTLAEGKVAINYHGKIQNLVPGEQANVNMLTNTLSVSTVNVKTEVSWKDGVFSFKEKSLKEIMVSLSRWYDVEVVFQNKSLETVKFNGVLRKHQNIEEILAVIMSSSINNYEINNKTIILK